ncbi:hypothetical protein I552_5823 [Mycobacterium xenopi 3993]|nr:hypothetical protein I552_5823 [Mycobacterium xenopi 3993]
MASPAGHPTGKLRSAARSHDPVGLHGVGDDVALGVGGGDLGEGQLLSPTRGAGMT